jgi:hypothetical protein
MALNALNANTPQIINLLPTDPGGVEPQSGHRPLQRREACPNVLIIGASSFLQRRTE